MKKLVSFAPCPRSIPRDEQVNNLTIKIITFFMSGFSEKLGTLSGRNSGRFNIYTYESQDFLISDFFITLLFNFKN